MTNTVSGSYRCRALHVRFTSSRRLENLAVRACDCSFCTKHGARTTTDPSGRLEIQICDLARLVRYRFGMNTADYLVCGECGIYAAAVLTDGERSWATLNINLLDQPVDDRFTAGLPVGYGAEDRDARLARRKAGWTPTIVRFAPGGVAGADLVKI